MTERTITITGTASIPVQYEQAEVTLRTHAEADKAARAQEKAADVGATLRDELRKRGLSEETMETQTFSLAHRSERRDASADDPAYQAEQTIIVSCEPSESEAVVTATSVAEASVQSVRPTLSSETRNIKSKEAIEAAMRDAREVAETIADAENGQIGRLLTAEHSSSKRSMSGFSDPVAASDLDFSFGPIDVSEEVTATFELQG